MAGGDPTRHPGTPGHRDPRAQRRERCRSRPPGIVIGRGNDADLRIDDPGVSRKHIEIRVEEPQDLGGQPRITVHDLGSTNGMSGQRQARRARRRSPTVRRSGSATRPCPCTSNKGELRLVRADPRPDPVRLPGDPVDLRPLVHLGDPLRHVRRPRRPPGRRPRPGPAGARARKAQAAEGRPSRAAASPPRSSSSRAATRARPSRSTRRRC